MELGRRLRIFLPCAYMIIHIGTRGAGKIRQKTENGS